MEKLAKIIYPVVEDAIEAKLENCTLFMLTLCAELLRRADVPVKIVEGFMEARTGDDELVATVRHYWLDADGTPVDVGGFIARHVGDVDADNMKTSLAADVPAGRKVLLAPDDARTRVLFGVAQVDLGRAMREAAKTRPEFAALAQRWCPEPKTD